MRKIGVAIFVLLSFSLLSAHSEVNAMQLAGEGYGKTEKEAKHAALADLSTSIEANVQSEFKQILKVVGHGDKEQIEEASQNLIQVKSQLPILGAKFTLLPAKKEILAKAILDSTTALVLYEAKLKDLIKEADHYNFKLEKGRSSGREYDTLLDLLALTQRFYKYKIVAVMLGSRKIPEFSFTEAEVRERMRSLEVMATSIDLAARLLTKGIDEKGIYVYPPTTRGSHEITQFASVVKQNLVPYLKTVSTPGSASYFMTGEYEIAKDGIELVYYLSDKKFNTIGARIVTFAPKSYAPYEVEPKTVDFDKLLYNGYVISSDLRVDLSTGIGRNNLLFGKGETVKLLVKMNRPGYFYMTGHVNKEKAKYSYLIDLQGGTGNRKFIYYVNADDANKWINLGEFETVAPFGVESLQIIASSGDLLSQIPSSNFDNKNELYIIANDPVEGVLRTRALKKKNDHKTGSAEAVLMFTTMEQ